MASDDVPRPRRLEPPSWLDVRLVAGILMVLVAVVVGARVFATADRYAEVWVAKSALVPGEQLRAADLAVGEVRFHGEASAYVAAGPVPTGAVVTRYVAAGELVPRAAVSAAPDSLAGARLVTVPVASTHLPVDLGRGDLVDIYVTPKSADTGRANPPSQVLAAVPVESVDAGSGFGAGDATVVVVAVPAAHAADLVRAVEGGTIDLVRLPAAAVAGRPSLPAVATSP